MRHQSHSVIQQFNNIVALYPDQIALKYKDQKVSYQQLDELSNGLANHLLNCGVVKGDIVSLLMERSVDMFVSMIAILKCGAAFLPLDIGNPTPRNRSCLEQARVKYLISDRDCGQLISQEITLIDSRQSSVLTAENQAFTPVEVDKDDLAYVMFTSGSTGKPKGVKVPHRAIIRLVLNTNYINIKHSDAILQFSAPSFDASTLEIWGALLNGGTLVIYSGDMLDPNLFKREIRDNNVTILWLTAGLFHIVVENFSTALAPLHTLLAGGDVLNPLAVNRVLDSNENITVINGYGPTENTTFTCCHRMTRENRPTGTVPIGVPVTSTEVYILDQDSKPVAHGESGELIVAGAGVSLGYIGIEHDTFFRDSAISKGLLYRTGDLVRVNENDEIEFVGRKDNLVKIRGFRVSLDEIRSFLLDIENLSDAVLCIQQEPGGDQLLMAYIKPVQPHKLEMNHIRKELRKNLPDYMIPDKLIECSKLPINRNGKLDIQSLLLNQPQP